MGLPTLRAELRGLSLAGRIERLGYSDNFGILWLTFFLSFVRSPRAETSVADRRTSSQQTGP